jgi:membrane-bound lytic murein transglycosylase D
MRGRKLKHSYLVSFVALLAVMVCGCTQAVDVQSDPDARVSISGQAAVASAPVQNRSGDASQLVMMPENEMPFVRSQPKSVAPFPLVLNRTVQHYVNQYLDQPQGLKQSFRRSRPFMGQMVQVLESEGLPPDLVYLAFAESGFSPDGDGPWQLSRATARRYGLVINKWVDERRDPIKSTRAAAEYLATLHDEARSDWRTTLVAWNNGDATIDHYLRLRKASYEKLMTRLPRHTRALMNRFMAVALIARHAQDYGLTNVTYVEPPHYRVVRCAGGTPLSRIATRTGVSVTALKKANPALLRDRVPPNFATYDIRIPDDELQAQLAEF